MRPVLSFCVLGFLCASSAAADARPAPRPVALILDDAKPATVRAATAGVGALGGRVLHTLGDVLVVTLPPGREVAAARAPGVRAVALNEVAISPRESATAASYGRSAWNAIAGGGPRFADRIEVVPEPLIASTVASTRVRRGTSSRRRRRRPGLRRRPRPATTKSPPSMPAAASGPTRIAP